MTNDWPGDANPARPPRASRAAGRPRPPREGIGPATIAALGLFASMALLGAVGAIVIVVTFVGLIRDLPDPTNLERIELPQQSVIYDRTGKIELARFGQFNREVVTFDQIPPVLVDATTAVEDRTFWDNSGFDTIGILAAGLDALRGQPRGASTITQQLVRQRLLSTNGAPETQVTLGRKLREIVQSIRLTQAYPGVEGKQRIMAAYLNQNYYGNDSYGVAAAAKSYFGVELKDLDLAQAAILAAIPQAPSNYDLVQNAVEECVDPTQSADTCTKTQLVVPPDSPIVQRRNLVLSLMENGRTPLSGSTYTAADFDAARNEKVVLAPQATPQWKAPQFVWQVRRELTDRLCGAGVDTCPALERGGLEVTTTLDLGLQAIAEKWVKAATIVPHAKDPRAAAKALGLTYQSWMANLRNKNLYNGALVALDYQTGELVAYVGSADAYATKATPQFQPRFDVLADGWRQPGSAFKPIMYATGIESRQITAASMFMDVVTDFGGYVPTDADRLERGPVLMRDALRFSLNIPAVKALAVIGNDKVQAQAEAMGVQFFNGQVSAGLSFALGVAEVHPVDLVRAYGTLADGGQLADRTTIISVVDANGETLISPTDRPKPQQVIGAGTAAIMTDILAGNTDPQQNPYWGKFQVLAGKQRRPATLKTGTNNDARDLNAYGYIAPPTTDGRAKGEYALAVGAWNGNSDNSLVSTPSAPVLSFDVTTYVWQGFLTEATKGWTVNAFPTPTGVDQAAVDPWTGLRASGSGPAVTDLFLPGTVPGGGLSPDTCGQAVLQVTGFEKDNPAWLQADLGWLDRASKGTGVRGGPQNTQTSYFYNGSFNPYGKSWGPFTGGACASPSPSVSIDPCGSPTGSLDPSATPWVPCPSPSESALPSESAMPSVEPTPLPSIQLPTPTLPPIPTPSLPLPTPPPGSPTPAPS